MSLIWDTGKHCCINYSRSPILWASDVKWWSRIDNVLQIHAI